jgi:hypothetical protein
MKIRIPIESLTEQHFIDLQLPHESLRHFET